MKSYARIQDGFVAEIIMPAVWDAPDPAYKDQISPEVWDSAVALAGTEIPIDQRYSPEFVAQLVDITDIDPVPQQGWTYDGTTFAPYVAPALTPEQVRADNRQQQAVLTAQASQAMAPVLVSLQLGDATDAETTLAKAWQTYYRALQTVDLTLASPQWPQAPQS